MPILRVLTPVLLGFLLLLLLLRVGIIASELSTTGSRNARLSTCRRTRCSVDSAPSAGFRLRWLSRSNRLIAVLTFDGPGVAIVVYGVKWP